METRKTPKTVALVAMGESRSDYIKDVTKAASREGVADETWVINKLADCFVHDVLFRMDDLMEPRKSNLKVIQDRHGVQIHDRLDKVLRNHNKPIITSKAYPEEYPSSVEYPLEKVINHLGYSYFATCPAYAIAFASFIGVEKILLYGCDYSYYYSPGVAEEGRGNMEFVTALVMAKGMQVCVAPKSSLLNTNVPLEQQFYGYKNLLEVKHDGDRYKVVFRPDIEGLVLASQEVEEVEAYKKLCDKYGVKTLEQIDVLIEEKHKRYKDLQDETGKAVVMAKN